MVTYDRMLLVVCSCHVGMYTTGVVGVSGFRLTIPARSAGLVYSRGQREKAATEKVLRQRRRTPHRLVRMGRGTAS